MTPLNVDSLRLFPRLGVIVGKSRDASIRVVDQASTLLILRYTEIGVLPLINQLISREHSFRSVL